MTEAKPFNLDDFTPHVGSGFTIRTASGDVEVTLVDATEISTPGQYSLLFHDAKSTVADHLPQSIYLFIHDELGERDIFIVPVGPDSSGTGISYEAIFTP